jgi:hypothetical protein
LSMPAISRGDGALICWFFITSTMVSELTSCEVFTAMCQKKTISQRKRVDKESSVLMMMWWVVIRYPSQSQFNHNTSSITYLIRL